MMLKLSLKNRLVLMSVTGLLVVSLSFLIGQQFSQRSSDHQLEQASVGYSQVLWSVASDSARAQMAAETKALTRSRDIIKAVKAGDVAALSEHIVPTFNRLKANGHIDGLVVSDMNGRVLAKTTDQALPDATIEFIKQVASEQKVLHDLIQVGPQGAELGVGFPLYSRGKPKGVAVYHLGLDKIAGRLAESGGLIASLAKPQGERFYTSVSAEAVTFDSMGVDLATPANLMMPGGDKTYATTVLPLKSSQAAHLATLVLQSDASEPALVRKQVFIAEMIAGVLIFAVVAIAIFWQMNTAFRPLTKAGEAIKAIADGDLSHEVSCESKNEISEMLQGIEEMRQRLRTIVEALLSNTEALQSVAKQASDTAENASSGASRQQMETQSVATAMTQMSSTVQEVSNNASQAANAANDANSKTQQGQSTVGEVKASIETLASNVLAGAEAIQQVQQESDAIGQILEVIRGIAEQTNLLALNAAIEAARAGEQGRGFAVVADEVRTLASRTQDSTSEIQAMIERLQSGTEKAVSVMDVSRAHADSSVQQALEANSVLEEINGAVEQISQMNLHIATAAEQQSAVAEDINRSVISISAIAEETATGAVSSNESSSQVNHYANELQALTSQFKL